MRRFCFSTKGNTMELVKIERNQIAGQTVQTANARDLHAFLEVKKDFSGWIKAQIKRAMLTEGRDYLVTQKGEQLPSGMKHMIEYHLTIEAGKHIAMLAGTAKGKEVREYFIECERRAPAPVAHSPAQMLVAMAQQFLAYEQEQQRQATEMARIQETVAVIEARTQPENKHFTVLGYANLVGHKIDYREASKIGRKCAELSRSQGLPIGDVKDPRFGRVHSYHESVLQAVIDAAA